MTRLMLGLACLSISLPAPAQEIIGAPKSGGKLVQEVWQTATIDGARAGYVLFTVREMTTPSGQPFLRATRKLALTIRRFGDVAKVDASTGTDETREGVVLGTFMQQGLGNNVELNVTGVVNGATLHSRAEGKMKFDKQVPWDPAVVGALGELQLAGKKKPQVGEQFDYLIYEPIINSIVTVQAKAEAYEKVQIGNQSPNLLKVVASPKPVQGITLPSSTFWFDAHYELVKSETLMPGLGKLVIERSTKDVAMQPCVGPDLGWRQSIPLKKGIMQPHDAAAITYRIRSKANNLKDAIPQDDRQTVRYLDDGSLELTIKPVRTAPTEQAAGVLPPDKEYLEPNNFLNSDDELVKQHAAAAVGGETDPWRKALKIERWVHGNMRAMNFTEAMAPAATVARTKSGDCTEYSMLTAAMCRAVGVPSRTALGLVYVAPQPGRPAMFAPHMWTEVWVRGKWIGLDSTLGKGPVGAAHIKVSDHSWYQVATMTPLMPLMRIMMGEPTIEIMQEQAVLTSRP